MRYVETRIIPAGTFWNGTTAREVIMMRHWKMYNESGRFGAHTGVLLENIQ
ncbi:hypothetical protein [Paenibacillus sp. CECT 9249]|uniref:hypothetical protein n=1 Tax=Paenibacillus sp. CECT 9249 TaxID=2845385 RepID=UPI001E30447B|nr:hypothetical protein [Paenibacillus sp. CECT 9249]